MLLGDPWINGVVLLVLGYLLGRTATKETMKAKRRHRDHSSQ